MEVEFLKSAIMLTSLLCTFFFSMHVKAEMKVPTAKETEQWRVELLEPSKDKHFAQSEKGKYEVYSLSVTNQGNKAYNVNIGAFRNEPSNKKMFGLAPQVENEIMNTGQTFSFTNFLVKEKTEELECVVTWEEGPVTLKNGKKASGRKYKETIVFTP